jgi:hypothetical protein
VVGDLVARLVAYLARHAPLGRLAASRGAEAVLTRACVVLTDWETAYRSGRLPARTAGLYTDPNVTVDALLAAVPDHQVAELVELAALAHHAGLLARLAPAPPARTGIAGPVFVQHWADGDLLLPTTDDSSDDSSSDDGSSDDGTAGGMLLLDVKTVTSARDPDRVARWLWQQLGYAWLDPADRYRIRTVGLYLARHGALVTWPIGDLATALLTSPDRPASSAADVDAAAAEFRRLVDDVLTDETGPQPAGLAAPAPGQR